MSSVVWLSLACLVIGLGIGLWGKAQQRQQVQTVSERVERLIETQPDDASASMGLRKGQSGAVRGVPEWLLSAYSMEKIAIGAAVTMLLAALLWWAGNFIVALFFVLLVVGSAGFFAWLRWQKHKRRVLQQLPSFIDGMVRMVVLGHATQSAFVMAANTAKEPLAAVVMQAASFSKAGMPMDQALRTASRHLEMKEFLLLAAVIQVGSKFGGRIDSLLERVAHFMRDKQQADRELKALSAEVRVSAWILSLLPLIVGGAIIILNAAYFMKMWNDPAGRWLALAGLGLQALGAFCLYRLARLED